jgi:DNA-binding transcriptional LysR family regulator
MVNLRSLDLNLLVILNALLDERHVSRAAGLVGLSQPAASAALERCRGLFGDALLERAGGGMRLTPRAEALRGPLQAVLADVAALVDPVVVALGDVQQVLRVILPDLPADMLIAPMMRMLAQTAPGIDVVVQPWLGAQATEAALIAGTTDIALAFVPGDVADLHREAVLRETYVVAMRAGHPALVAFDLGAWLAFPHIVVSGRGDMTGPLDAVLADRGLARRVGLVVPSFQQVAPVLRQSDMMALLPSRLADAAGLVTQAPPLGVEGFTLHLLWHRRRAGDAAVLHVADVLRDVLMLRGAAG